MAKLYFNTRDEMTCIDTDLLAFVKADGNYCKIVYMTGKMFNISYGISKVEAILKENNSKQNRFVRLGRSFVINHRYVFKIEPLKQQMVFSDGKNDLRIQLTKQILKAYKDAILKRTETQKKP